jgi:hypothetical protein
MLRRVLALVTACGLVLVVVLGLQSQDLYMLTTFAQSASFTPNPNCSPNMVPIGQQNPSEEPMPMDPIWCFNVTQGPTTRVTGANDWVDNFQTNTQLQRLSDGNMGYRVFDNATNGPSPVRTQHFVNNNDWFTDDGNMGKSDVAGMLSPNRSFNAENGKLVVEADAAPGINFQSGGGIFQEIDISQAPAPTGTIVDHLYGHGQFGGAWTIGCRLNGGSQTICAVESSSFNVPNNQASCNMESPSRIMEISFFEICGTTHSGGSGSDGGYARTCALNGPYDNCLDRYRIELTANGLSIYVNGQLYFIDAGWDAAHQIPASVMAGPWYVYYTDWVGGTNAGPVYRFAWQRLAVNPHTSTGVLAAPSASPTFDLPEDPNAAAPTAS